MNTSIAVQTAAACPWARRAKLHTSDMLLVAAEVGSAVAACGLLHWFAA